MPAFVRPLALLLAPLIILATPLTAPSQVPQRNFPGKKRPALPNEYALLAQYPEVMAKIVSTDPTNLEATIEIDVPHLQRNASSGRSYSRGRRGRSSRPSVHLEVDHLDFNLPITSNATFRKMTLPVEYDDRGELKKYTSAEKAELKGKSNLPGYTATLQELVNGTPVKVKLLAPKKIDPTGFNKPSIKSLIALGPPVDMPAAANGSAVPAKKKKN